MSNWNTIRLSDFLQERDGRYKPGDAFISGLQRLEKIDFNGIIHLSEKATKTDMIIIQPGDLIISGINVAKGAVAIWEGIQPIVATIHYSAYCLDQSKVELSFLKRFLKSPAFIKAIQDQVKGGIKTEIKAKHLLPLIVPIPNLKEQQAINQKFDSIDDAILQLTKETPLQSDLMAKLRQSILQEAIEGKLTRDWRREHPVRQGDPDYDAEALLEQIKAEKQKLIAAGKIKKEKPLASIRPEDMPFALPEGWVWTRLGEIIRNPPRNGFSPKEVNYTTTIKTLKLGATTWGKFIPEEYKYVDEIIPKDSVYWLKPNDILIQRSNSIDYVGVSAVYTGKEREFIYPDLMMKIEMIEPLSIYYSYNALSSPLVRAYYRNMAKGAQKSMPKIDQPTVNNTLIPLPPLAEQRAVVDRVEKFLGLVDEMEAQAKERGKQADALLQAVLREAFEPEKQSSAAQDDRLTSFQQMQIVGAVVEEIEKANQHQGEMVLAKYLYLLYRIYGVKSGFTFTRWHFGPYDPSIRRLISNRTYFTHAGQTKHQTIGLQSADKLFKYPNPQVDEVRKHFPEILSTFSAYKKPEERAHKVELLATVLKVIEDSETSELDSVYCELKNWKTDKGKTGYASKAEKFSEQEVAACIEFSRKRGWI